MGMVSMVSSVHAFVAQANLSKTARIKIRYNSSWTWKLYAGSTEKYRKQLPWNQSSGRLDDVTEDDVLHTRN